MKQQATLIIRGDLTAGKLNGGGIYQCPEERIEEYFVTGNAIELYGHIEIDRIYGNGHVVVVTGAVVARKGGCDGTQQ